MIAETIAKALGGRKSGRGWIANCPAHDDRTPSLSVTEGRDGRVLVHCHADCDQTRVIEVLQARGLWAEAGERRFITSAPPAVSNHQADRGNAKRTELALSIWEAAVPAEGTLVENYLHSRGLHLPPPDTIRFHAGLKHPSGAVLPAMVALVARSSDNAPMAIHRTFLARDGAGKASVEPQKMMLGPVGGGAVRLVVAGPHLLIGEGIESTLSAIQAIGLPGWAGLSAGGIRAMELPALPLAAAITIAADSDPVGQTAAEEAAARWHAEGRCVRIATPPSGKDFNDLIAEEHLHVG